MLQNFWDKRDLQGLKLLATWLDQNSSTSRGQDVREAELADRIAYKYSDLRPVEGEAVLTIKENGKTNQVRLHSWLLAVAQF
jgi:hypothetical protein